MNNEKEFIIKRNILTSIFNSGIHINWNLPQIIQLESYGLKNIQTKFGRSDILELFEILKCSTSLTNFYEKIKFNEFEIKYKNICEYDSYYQSHFQKEISLKIRQFRNVFPVFSEGNNIITKIMDLIKKNVNWLGYFIIAICIKIAENISNDPINISHKTIEELISDYNGNIDIFLFSIAFYSFLKVPKNEQISRNDFNDIFHLSYIKSNQIIVSNDRIFDRLLGELFPKNIIKYEDFISLIK
jgi:hypothetical protein